MQAASGGDAVRVAAVFSALVALHYWLSNRDPGSSLRCCSLAHQSPTLIPCSHSQPPHDGVRAAFSGSGDHRRAARAAGAQLQLLQLPCWVGSGPARCASAMHAVACCFYAHCRRPQTHTVTYMHAMPCLSVCPQFAAKRLRLEGILGSSTACILLVDQIQVEFVALSRVC